MLALSSCAGDKAGALAISSCPLLVGEHSQEGRFCSPDPLLPLLCCCLAGNCIPYTPLPPPSLRLTSWCEWPVGDTEGGPGAGSGGGGYVSPVLCVGWRLCSSWVSSTASLPQPLWSQLSPSGPGF